MAEPISYKVQNGETLIDIAKKLGIKDWMQLKEYHDQNSSQPVMNTPHPGFELQTPPQEEIYDMNGEAPPLDPVEEQKEAEETQKEEKKKEEEEKKQEEASKSEHDGKYFVVHNAKCVCNQAKDPSKTAALQVTSHKIIVFNDQAEKLAATEDDRTFMPPAATFGQCKLKPSSGDFLACVLAAAPKWSKTYESTTVQGKKTLTEISELQCMTGGLITIKEHGQTDSVSNAHADNTNPLELAAVNPAIEQPKKKEEYPIVTSISITEIENRPTFKARDSKDEREIIYVRKNEETSFKANLKSGNQQLTSWMVYTDHAGKKENRLLLREQIGVEFSQSFNDFGKFRVEGYGKPKKQDFEKGKYDKCDSSCSIDVEVVENTLLDIEVTSGDFSMRTVGGKNKFRKGVPSVFKAKFFIQKLTDAEKSKLIMFVTDALGNNISDGVVNKGTILTFTPQNTNASYTITAKYTTESGKEIEKKISGETEGNAVLAISHAAHVVRPGTAMSFNVSKMKYNFDTETPSYNLTTEESNNIKWNLNGVEIGRGKSITIPGDKLRVPGKYVVEAYSISSNATGKNAKDEEDDWRFEVKENDIVSFTLNGTPKVGKPITATVEQMVFADLLPTETIHWQAPFLAGTGKTVTITPKVAGTFDVSCKINNNKGTNQKVTVVEAKITSGFWNDFGGSEISEASWGQKVDYCIKGENIEGEDIEFAIFDKDTATKDDDSNYRHIVKGAKNGNYASHRIDLSPEINKETTNAFTQEVKLFGKARLVGFDKSVLQDITPLENTSKHLTVNNDKKVYRAIIGDANGRARHNPVDYDMKSFVYANTTYPKGTKLNVKIFEKKSWYENNVEAKVLATTGTVGEDGTLVTEVSWGKLKDAKQNKATKMYYAKICDEHDVELFNGSDSSTPCITNLVPQSILLKEVSYAGAAVIVGNEQISQQTNGTCVCKEYDLSWGNKFTCDERKKVLKICANLWGEAKKKEMANHLMNCMALETGEKFKPDTGYLSGGATGLVQWTGTAINAMNRENKYNKGKTLTKALLASMTIIDQLDYVELYFRMWIDSGKNIKDALDLYMCIWCPAAVGRDDSFICYSEKDSPVNYTANQSIDGEHYREKYTNSKGKVVYNTVGKGNGDKKITKGELRPRLKVKEVSGLNNKASDFICNTDSTNSLNAKDIITFHIYANGSIEKHIPKKIEEKNKNKYKYTYHDKENMEHDICILDKITVQNWIVGSKDNKGKGWEKRIAGGKTRYYQKGNGEVELVKLKLPINYNKNGVNIKIGDNTTREYINPLAVASMIGAVAECGYNDFNFNGSTSQDGTGAPSVTHVNGVAFDFRYLRKDKTGNNLHIDEHPEALDIIRQEKFIDALGTFGYSKFYSYNIIVNKKNFILKNSTHLVDHNHHLHIRREGYSPKFKEIKA